MFGKEPRTSKRLWQELLSNNQCGEKCRARAWHFLCWPAQRAGLFYARARHEAGAFAVKNLSDKCFGQLHVYLDFLWSKSVVLEGSSETAPKWRTIPAAEGQDFSANPKKSKKNRVEIGQNETISGQIINCSKFNKLSLLTLRASNLKYTCNPPKHLFSQFSEYFKSTLFNNANSKNCIFVDYVVLSPKNTRKSTITSD